MSDPKPEPSVTITIDGTEYTLVMSYGLLNRLLKQVGSDVDMLAAGMVSDLRDKLFAQALNKRGKSGAIENFTIEALEDINMSGTDAQLLLAWITDHILDFFISAAVAAQATEAKYANKTAGLMQSKNGTPI